MLSQNVLGFADAMLPGLNDGLGYPSLLPEFVCQFARHANVCSSVFFWFFRKGHYPISLKAEHHC